MPSPLIGQNLNSNRALKIQLPERNPMLTLDRAIAFAVLKHSGQKDKGGNSYIRHPLRVMEKMDSEDEMIVAILHDVVEDTPTTLNDLKELGCTEMQIMA